MIIHRGLGTNPVSYKFLKLLKFLKQLILTQWVPCLRVLALVTGTPQYHRDASNAPTLSSSLLPTHFFLFKINEVETCHAETPLSHDTMPRFEKEI